MADTRLPDRAAIVQRDMKTTVARFRPQKARTLQTFEQGTRKETARLAGIQIPYFKDRAHGQTWYNPIAGETSFKKSTKETTGAMYAGVAFRNMNIYLEDHMLKDMERGFIPDSYIKERRRRIETHMEKKNWASIGDGNVAQGLAIVSSATGGGLVTCANDNNARGRSKGSYRLSVTTSDDPLYYDAVNTGTDTVVATFYVSSKPAATTFQAAGYTVGNAAALNVAGLLIVESGSYKKELIGIGGHISDASRIYQGADTTTEEYLKNMSLDASDGAITPTLVHSAKGILQTRMNDEQAADNMIAHLTWGNYRVLAAFGYSLRQYNADGGKANTTFGLPNVYKDEDTIFVCDADYEDGYIDFREKKPYFEYVQKEFGLKTNGGNGGRHEWIGSNQVGSTNSYENYNEACNIVWDGRGMDGNGEEGGSPNSAVFIKNIAIPTENQVNYGVQ